MTGPDGQKKSHRLAKLIGALVFGYFAFNWFWETLATIVITGAVIIGLATARR